ncbi:unnamed protein product [Ambrosiozyma monospora]|uniref:Unnamed protein product n=1 Tax=Ambrosiozyma monospora TaxID=43982 RepID=A0ACB5T5Z3_AMBMO|nr:unnamed protein product [Ambrosiozyma monospora]
MKYQDRHTDITVKLTRVDFVVAVVAVDITEDSCLACALKMESDLDLAVGTFEAGGKVVLIEDNFAFMELK